MMASAGADREAMPLVVRGAESGKPMFRNSAYSIVAVLSAIYILSGVLAGMYLGAGAGAA
jgi:hypothetical protein